MKSGKSGQFKVVIIANDEFSALDPNIPLLAFLTDIFWLSSPERHKVYQTSLWLLCLHNFSTLTHTMTHIHIHIQRINYSKLIHLHLIFCLLIFLVLLFHFNSCAAEIKCETFAKEQLFFCYRRWNNKRTKNKREFLILHR